MPVRVGSIEGSGVGIAAKRLIVFADLPAQCFDGENDCTRRQSVPSAGVQHSLGLRVFAGVDDFGHVGGAEVEPGVRNHTFLMRGQCAKAFSGRAVQPVAELTAVVPGDGLDIEG